MTGLGPETLLAVFVLFCRIGGCLMLMPGFSSQRVPMRIRLFLAFAVTLVMAPLLVPVLQPMVPTGGSAAFFPLVLSELLKGLIIGFIGRLFIAAVEFAGNAIAAMVGYGALPGMPVEGTEPVPALTSLITLSATLLFFVLDLHWLVLRVIHDSYASLPPGELFEAQPSLVVLADKLHDTIMLAARLAAPFVIYAIIINLAMGITNKLSPQIPVFFVALPFILAGGLILLFLTSSDLMRVYAAQFGGWLAGV